jgi:hypothetical protein
MQDRRAGLAVAAVAVVAVVVLFIVLKGGDDESGGGATTAPTIVITDGQPVGGVQDLTFAEGDDIRFIVDSDVDEEVHFHGYDIAMDVKAGGKVEFDVPATIPGVFEVELEHSVVQIAEITVE